MKKTSYQLTGYSLACALLISLAGGLAAAEKPGMLTIDHYFKLGSVSDPQLSPEGDWIAYTVTREDLEDDESRSRIWMVRSSGGEAVPLTAEDESSYHPRWSPDGQYLAFLSARGEDDDDDEDEGQTQIWSLYRSGGEAKQLTDTAQSVKSFEWSPDSGKLALILQDPTPEELAAKEQGDDYEEKTAPPWVVDRKQFKTDYVGYLDRRRTHIHILDLASSEMIQLTSGDFDDSEPAWSPNGLFLAFTSNRTEDPDSNYNTDIWITSLDPEGKIFRVTANPGADASPAWSPDGKLITHTSITDVDASLYATQHLAVSSAGGKDTKILTADLDRMVFSPRFSSDSRQVWFLLEDAGEQSLSRIPRSGGEVERLVTGKDTVSAFALGKDDQVALVASRPDLPAEVFTLEENALVQKTFTNQAVLAELELGEVEKTRFKSSDGTAIEGFVIKPPGFKKGKRYPVILDIHGGPQSQYDHSFHFEAQLYAANGYLVVHPNPRGSTGYGQEFCLAIWQDWGGPDYDDVMAAVDDVIDRGWGDPDRMAVMGWSYGGMLTNHVITKTDRFKAAATGASATLYVTNYGHDMYQRWWDQELGLPWDPEARERYEKISPFNAVENVVTPTLIMGGEKDWNVPIINSEQLYIALKKLGVETKLVVYPDEYHGSFAPTHQKDLFQRHMDWFGEHLGSK
jgi:dipeptidyl aminopeptidase/acylaminoacyl peptidase